MDNKDTSPTREPKRQKKLHYGSSDAVLKCHEYSEQMGPHSGQAAVSNFSEECKSKEDTSAVLSTTPFNGSYVNGSVCAFCQSSKITEVNNSPHVKFLLLRIILFNFCERFGLQLSSNLES